MINEIITVGSASFIASRIFKCMGKREFAELIGLCGWVGVGIAFFSGINGISDSVSNGWVGNFVRWLASIAH